MLARSTASSTCRAEPRRYRGACRRPPARMKATRPVAFAALVFCQGAFATHGDLIPVVSALQPLDLVLVINDNDPASVETGAYYQSRRGIPQENVVHVRFASGVAALGAAEFERVREEVQVRAPA